MSRKNRLYYTDFSPYEPYIIPLRKVLGYYVERFPVYTKDKVYPVCMGHKSYLIPLEVTKEYKYYD